jgi:hypothetical protein
MVAELAKLYEVPLDDEDPEDIWIIFAYAVGGKASELAGGFGMKVGGAATKHGIKRVISKEILKQLQAIGRMIGVKILQKTLIKYAVPVVSIGIGSTWNYFSTKAIGKIAQKHFSSWREQFDGKEDEEGPIIEHKPNDICGDSSAIPGDARNLSTESA